MKWNHRLVAGALALAAFGAQALVIKPYSAQALAAAQAGGQPVVLHFHASWCPTCRAQDKVFEAMKSEPGLDLTVLSADYDSERALRKQLKVPAQATLIVYHGAQERTRSTGQTDPDALRALLKKAL